MTKLESIIEELKALPPNRLENAADYIHRSRINSDAERAAIIDRTVGFLTAEEGDELGRIH